MKQQLCHQIENNSKIAFSNQLKLLFSLSIIIPLKNIISISNLNWFSKQIYIDQKCWDFCSAWLWFLEFGPAPSKVNNAVNAGTPASPARWPANSNPSMTSSEKFKAIGSRKISKVHVSRYLSNLCLQFFGYQITR